MARPKLWLIGGPNGAGKTTLVQRGPLAELVSDGCFLNPDDETLSLLKTKGFLTFSSVPTDILRTAFVESAQAVFQNARTRLNAGETVCIETVLSTEKYCELVEPVIAAGGYFFLIYVFLRSPELACRRVNKRVLQGGHNVPVEKIAERWHRSLERLPWFIARAKRFWIYDNSDENEENPPLLVAEGENGVCKYLIDDSPVAERLRPFLCQKPSN